MTPEQKIKHLILMRHADLAGVDVDMDKIGLADVEEQYQDLIDADDHWDAMNEVREGEVETGLPCEFSRHYESKAVAAQYLDGSWVGWTYWYGGGKHGEPESIDWIGDAYALDCTEQEKLITVRSFSKLAA